MLYSEEQQEKIECREEFIREYAEGVFNKIDDSLTEILDAIYDIHNCCLYIWLEKETNLTYGTYTIQEFLSKLNLNMDCYLDSNRAEEFLSLSFIKALYEEIEEGDILEEYKNGTLTALELYEVLEEVAFSNDCEIKEKFEDVMYLLDDIVSEEWGIFLLWAQVGDSNKFQIIIDADAINE